MGVEEEAIARAFLAGLEGELEDPSWVDPAVDRMASNARYQVVAWNEPFVGHDAIRAELLRQAGVVRDVRIEILAIASSGGVVFVERIDSMLLRGKPIASHIVGVIEVDAAGKIAAWRDYLDTHELAVQLRQS